MCEWVDVTGTVKRFGWSIRLEKCHINTVHFPILVVHDENIINMHINMPDYFMAVHSDVLEPCRHCEQRSPDSPIIVTDIKLVLY